MVPLPHQHELVYILAELDRLVWEDLCALLTHPEQISTALMRARGGASLPQELEARRTLVRQGRDSLQRQLERLTEAYLGGVIPLVEYERRRRDLERKEQALAQQEDELSGEAEQRVGRVGLAEAVTTFCQRVQQGLAQASFEQKRQLVMLLIDRVIVADGQVEICCVFPTSLASEQARFCQLRKDYFHHPALGLNLKVSLAGVALHDFQLAKAARGQERWLVRLATVSPNGIVRQRRGRLKRWATVGVIRPSGA